MLRNLIRRQISSIPPPEKLLIRTDTTPKIVRSKLDSGIEILTEQTAFPFHSDIGIAFRAGIRNETQQEFGSLFNLQQYMYQTSSSDYLDNFERTLRTGCMLDYLYDQEVTYWKCSFLQEDLENILDIVMRLALTPKTISKEDREMYLEYKARNKDKIDIPMDEIIFKGVYKGQGMGNSKTANMILPSQEAFLKFQLELLTPKNMIIGYSGGESRNIVALAPQVKLREQQRAQFISNLYREEAKIDEINIGIIFQGYEWSHPDMAIFQILNSILGTSTSWSSGGPGKGMRARTTLNLMHKVAAIETAASVSHHLTDGGLFGLRVAGDSNYKDTLLKSAIQELKLLMDQMSDEEFERGRNILKSLIELNLERQADRLEESVKNLIFFNECMVYRYSELIDRITKKQLQEKVKQLLFQTDPCVIYYGKGTQQLPDLSTVIKMLRM